MQPDFRVECRSYDQTERGSWRTYRLHPTTLLNDENIVQPTEDCIRLWLPAGTPMEWTTGTRPLRYNCLQFFWPERWYMLSAFYNEHRLVHTYATIIQPPAIEAEHLSYVDLDLSILVKPDMTCEVLTQAEFEHMVDLMHYSEETRLSALMALRTLTNSARLGVGLFAIVPHTLRQADFHRAGCLSGGSRSTGERKNGDSHAQAH